MSRRSRNHEMESMRQIIRQAHSTYIPEKSNDAIGGPGRPPGPKVPLPPFAFAQKIVVEGVNNNPHREWLRFAYTESQGMRELEALTRALRPKADNLPDSCREAGRMLVPLALMDIKRRKAVYKKMWSIRQLCGVLSLDQNNWGRNFSPYWISLRADIEKMDNAALTALLGDIDLKQAESMGFYL